MTTEEMLETNLAWVGRARESLYFILASEHDKCNRSLFGQALAELIYLEVQIAGELSRIRAINERVAKMKATKAAKAAAKATAAS